MESEKDAWDILTRWTGTNTGLFEKLRAAGHERTLTAGHILMAEGEAPKGVFLILSGSISVVVYSSNGHEVHLSTLSAGDWVGEMAVLSGGPRSAYAVAAEKVQVAAFAPHFFLDTMDQNGDFATRIARLMSNRVAETSRRMFEFAAFSSYGRIYAEVIRRSKPGPDTEERHVSPAPSITELAAQLSVARETASRAISRLERMHLLARETKHWRVLAPEKLANLID
jgi:CRP-like cAMP-binding protein